MSKSNLIGVLILCLLLLSVLTVAKTSVPETPGAHVGGTLTIGMRQTVGDLDPRIVTKIYDWYIIGEIFDEFIALDPDSFEPRPCIAKEWEVLGDDRVRFYLNEGIKFHNGEDLTADDVKFTLEWIADPANGSSNYASLKWLQEVEIIDDYTVEIVTKPEDAPYAPMFNALRTFIVPKDTVLNVGDEAFNLHPIGSGPYKFVEWVSGNHITLERNESYWLVYPNLDRVIYRPIQELSVMMLELEAGGIDIADTMPAQDVDRFEEMERIRVQKSPGIVYYYVGFNLSHAPSSDIRFRKAVYLSVDMEAAVFTFLQGKTGIRAYCNLSPMLWANDNEWQRENVALQEDDEEAKRLFADLKTEGVIPPDFTTTIITPLDPRRKQLATIIATNLIENGIPADVQPLDFGPLISKLQRSDADPTGSTFDIFLIGWGLGPEPHDQTYFKFSSEAATIGGATSFTFYSNPEVDRLLNEAARTLDQKDREELYIQVQRIVFPEYVHIPGYFLHEINGVNVRVHDFMTRASMWLQLCSPFSNVWVEE